MRTSGGTLAGRTPCAPTRSFVSLAISAVFFILALVFVWRSFYGMRIGTAT